MGLGKRTRDVSLRGFLWQGTIVARRNDMEHQVDPQAEEIKIGGQAQIQMNTTEPVVLGRHYRGVQATLQIGDVETVLPSSSPDGPECLPSYLLVQAEKCVVGRIRPCAATVVYPASWHVVEARSESHRSDVGKRGRVDVLAKNVLVDDVADLGRQTHDLEALIQLVPPYLLTTYDTRNAFARIALCELARKSESPWPLFNRYPSSLVWMFALVLLSDQDVFQCQLACAVAKREFGCNGELFERLLDSI
jgi:hypothetical protein